VFQLRKLIHEYPVLVLPTHRSYMDFLLVSYIFYHYDLPLPVIATAMGLKIHLLMTLLFDFFATAAFNCQSRRALGGAHVPPTKVFRLLSE